MPPRRLVPLPPKHLAAAAAALVEGGLDSSNAAAANHLDIAGMLESSSTDAELHTRFSNDVNAHPLDENAAFKLVEIAGRLGPMVFDRISSKGPDGCVKSADSPADCISGFIARLGRRAFRRPLDANEHSELVALFAQQRPTGGSRAAVSAVAQALFLSPAFLHRSELGDETGRMTSHEVAQALSFWLLSGPPDASLDRAADADALRTPDARIAEVRRLLARPGATASGAPPSIASAPGLRQFFYEWLEVTPSPPKDERLYGDRGAAHWEAAQRELDSFLGDNLWNRGGGWDALLTDNALYPTSAMVHSLKNPTAWTVKLRTVPAALCDPSAASCAGAGAAVRIAGPELDGPRAGLLTSPLVMASQSPFDRTDAVQRGRWVRHVFLCSEPPPPPPTVVALPPPPSRQLTAKQRFSEHSADPSCAACHRLMDPIGFALEPYDAVGRYRDRELSPELEKEGLYFESGKPIDPSGTLARVTLDGKLGDFPFADATAMAAMLTRANEAQRCFVNSTVSYAVARYDHPEDHCMVDELWKQFVSKKFNVVDLLADVVAREEFSTRGEP